MIKPNAWRETCEQMAADAAMNLGRMVKAEREARHTMHKHLLRAQAEVLKGLLAVVESRLDTKEAGHMPPSNEKIPVD